MSINSQKLNIKNQKCYFSVKSYYIGFSKNLKKGVQMTDENKSETEVETQDLEEKYEMLLEEKNQEIENLQKDLENQKSETQEYISLSQRLQADFENFKKITDKRNKELVKFANENVIKDFLDCYEDFGRALETENNEDLREGIQLIYNKFSDILAKEGVSEIPAKGEKFDFTRHEALMTQESDDVENGYIIDELMKGYMYKDKVLKYSKVIVCKK
jgi:molecular chaperone GrpE